MNEKEIIIINPYFKKNRYNKDYYLQEAKDLIKSINLGVNYSLSIGIDKINSRTYLNSGNISKLCKIHKDKINLKGKTAEKLGVIGKEKAIACEVIASIQKNYD